MTTTASPTRRKGKPFNPSAPVHDRRATDLLRNAQVAVVEIDDPYEEGAKVLGFRSIRKDPLADMFARKQIAQWEFETGRHWERAYESSEIGHACGIDPSKEAVDGGRIPEVLTDRQIGAIKELKLAREALGNQGNYLIINVLGTKKTLEEIAREAHWGRAGEAQYKYVRRRFHECLTTLSVLFGYAMATRG